MTGVVLGVVVVLTLLNLVLLLGVVRRLREHETRLAAVPGEDPPRLIAAAGTVVGAYATRSVDGRAVDSESPWELIGFFSPQCDACHERLPEFRRTAAGHPGRGLAVVVSDGGDTASLVAELGSAATVVLEQHDGPLSRAFDVRGFPAFALVDGDGTIRASGYELPLQPA